MWSKEKNKAGKRGRLETLLFYSDASASQVLSSRDAVPSRLLMTLCAQLPLLTPN